MDLTNALARHFNRSSCDAANKTARAARSNVIMGHHINIEAIAIRVLIIGVGFDPRERGFRAVHPTLNF